MRISHCCIVLLHMIPKSVMIYRLAIRSFCSKASEMVRILNVAEKNDAAKSLSELMSRGRFRRREGFSRFNKIYEFEYNLLNYQNCTMVMTSVSGHLLNCAFIGQYGKWYGCSPVALFDAPMQKICPQDYVDIKRTLEREVRNCSALVIWTDGDREGENIGYEIIQVCQNVKPNIRLYRARFSEITPGAVERACRTLADPDKNVSDAVDVRQELDLRIGAAFTRFQTLRLQKVFPAVLAEQLISYGSCQFPTLGFVVERYKQVQAFVPEPFWKIKVTHETSEEETVEFNWNRVRLFDHIACLVLYQHCLEDPIAKVVDVTSKPKSKWRPVALDTVELEKLASRKLKINAKETMKIAEKLYTQGFISYPRTETNIFPKDLDIRGLVEQQTQDPQWGGFAAGLLEQGPHPRNGKKTDQAHPPIHPTKYTNSLQGNEKRVYEFVVRHFLACCSEDAQGKETIVEIEINEEKFSASGLMIIARNYLDVYPYDKWNAKVIPVFQAGESFQPKSIEMNQGETSPPSLLTEADLIALMDKHGIGTDATHADHIETIKSRLYVGVRPDGKFVPGELGMGLVEGYDAMGFEMSKPHLRAELEADLKRICDGQADRDAVLANQVQKYKEVFVEACRQAAKIDQALSEYFGDAQQYNAQEIQMESSPPVQKCPNCGQDMLLKTKKDGKGYFMSCMGYPNCRAAIWFPDSVLQASVGDTICNICTPGPVRKIKFKFKKGSVPPYIPLEYEGCVGGCDETLREVLNINIKISQGSTGGSNVQRGSGNTRGRGGSARGGGVHRGSQGGPDDSGYGSSLPNTGNQTRNVSMMSTGSAPTQTRQPLAQIRSINTPGIMGTGRGRGSTDGGGGTGGAEGAIVCNCGDDARLLTVRKEGPNQGRQFYSCSKPQDSKCNFFLWADENPNQEDTGGGRGGRGGGTNQGYSNGSGQNQYNHPSHGGHGGSNDAGDVFCNCGEAAKQLIVHKEGPNKGRPFYACNKPRDQGCGFFQWGDEDGSSGRGGGFSHQGGNSDARGTGRGRGKGKESAGGPSVGQKRKRKCGNCGEEGHNRLKCPN